MLKWEYQKTFDIHMEGLYNEFAIISGEVILGWNTIMRCSSDTTLQLALSGRAWIFCLIRLFFRQGFGYTRAEGKVSAISSSNSGVMMLRIRLNVRHNSFLIGLV